MDKDNDLQQDTQLAASGKMLAQDTSSMAELAKY